VRRTAEVRPGEAGIFEKFQLKNLVAKTHTPGIFGKECANG
jgi:hypothetical protein